MVSGFSFTCFFEAHFQFSAVIFPTLWEYLISLGVAESDVYYLGLCIAAVTLTDMFMGLIIGRLLDKFTRVLPFILILNLFQIIGSCVYFLGISPGFILLSRLIEGLGNASFIVFTTDVCRATNPDERTPVLLLFNVAQQLGLLLGPACNLFLRNLDFSLFGLIHVNKLNAPGFFLIVIYLGFEILAYFLYYDLAKITKENSLIAQEEVPENENNEVTIADEAPEIIIQPDMTPNVPWSRYAEELMKGEIIVLIFIRFIGLFGQTCLETIVTPMMKSFFDYGDFANRDACHFLSTAE